jgi:hypothetical protein
VANIGTRKGFVPQQAFTIQTHAEWSYWFVCFIPEIIIANKSDIENTKAF